MAEQAYTYSISGDFPGSAVNVLKLADEITASAIITAIARVQGNPDGDDTDRIDIVFKAPLSTGDKTILDGDTSAPAGGLIAAHDNTPTVFDNEVVITGSTSGPENSVRVYPAPNRPGYYLCDRDIKVKTSVYDSALSFEDKKVNLTTLKQENWDEVTSVGCYKGDNDVGFTLCDDQADADVNATLSVWDFWPHDQTVNKTPIGYDLKGGALAVIGTLQGDKDLHRIYAVVAPNIPGAYGGGIRFFDGYLEPYEGGELSAVSQLAVFMNTTASTEATRLRLYIYYPPGATQSHIFRVIMFRPIGTF